MASGAQGIASERSVFGFRKLYQVRSSDIGRDPDNRHSEACARAERLIDLDATLVVFSHWFVISFKA